MDISYILNHLGETREQYAHAVVPPIWQTSIFAHPDVQSMREAMSDEYAHHVYTRGNNPTVAILRKKLAALEQAEEALVFGSGAAAMAAAVLALVKQGDHVIVVDKPYSWTRKLAGEVLAKFGVAASFIDGRDLGNFVEARTDATRLIILESPNSLTFEQQDLAAVAKFAAAHGIKTIVDNSYATPLGQTPLAQGIDIVVHSGTKYLNGHSDVVMGAVCACEALCREIFYGPYMTLGAILPPHDAWLAIRGLRTLVVRMERIANTTRKILAFLGQHPKIKRLYHPALDQNAGQALKIVNGLLSFELDADIAGIERFCDALRRFLLSISWGGHESLVFPVAGVRDWRGREHEASVPLNLVRLAIGLEEADVLIEDLDQALRQI